MTLTGVPLLVLAVAATAAAGAATVRLWPRRLLPVRIAGVLLTEALLTGAVGLAVNRQEGFYPSWEALAGNTGTVAHAGPAAVGRLDGRLPPGTPVPWRPDGWQAWRLAGPPRLVVPAAYTTSPRDTFPVVLALVPAAAPAVATARRLPDVVTVVAVPGPGTTAAELRTLPGRLRLDARVTTTGWDLVAPGRSAALADALARTQPPGFAAARGWEPDQLPAPLAPAMRLPA
ncbi:hypothetical protein [Nucisporomicrobium flavum]|uniref:hypothetical protein n=1 Tax=Nucisporomicrobium flavum TaxID=2785915 RepID=UPI001F39B8F4|nr:hypothetical protein [Nucisporomicrobium flavum]